MPKVNTHLHIALKLSEKMCIKDLDSFLLGSAFPDCWNTSAEKSLRYHYKDEVSCLCDLERFKQTEEMDDFGFGYYFHLWVDNRILKIDIGDISKQDCLVCDMAVITPIVHHIGKIAVTGKKHQALQNILALKSEHIPEYSVPEEKRKRYDAILDLLVDEFLKEQ